MAHKPLTLPQGTPAWIFAVPADPNAKANHADGSVVLLYGWMGSRRYAWTHGSLPAVAFVA